MKFDDSSCNGMDIISNLKIQDGDRQARLNLMGDLKQEDGDGRGLEETGSDEQR